jgi:hypothetical protein
MEKNRAVLHVPLVLRRTSPPGTSPQAAFLGAAEGAPKKIFLYVYMSSRTGGGSPARTFGTAQDIYI